MRVEGDFERDGAVCVRGAVSPEHLLLGADAIDAVLADPSPLSKRASAADERAINTDLPYYNVDGARI